MQPIARFVNEGLPGVPRPISPKTHKVLDVLTTSAFLLAGAFMWSSNRRASAAAFLNAGLVLGMALFTDYDGDGRRPLSFEAHDESGEVVRWFGSNTDITEQKQIEADLQKARQELELRVQDRTSDLQLANEELRQLSSRLQQMQDEERRRLARGLHDSAGQLIAAIAMNIAVIKTEANKLSAAVAKRVDDNDRTIEQLSTEIRTISHLLHPPLLDEVGLASALRWYVDGFAERSKIAATLEMADDLERFPADMEIAVFRAVQECLTNVHRHSGCRSCAVKVFTKRNQLHGVETGAAPPRR